MAKKKKTYGYKETAALEKTQAPRVAHEPPRPRRYDPPIALIGCGGVSAFHLRAYRQMGLNVVALCDSVRLCAEERRREFFPHAEVYEDYRRLLKRDDIEVVDLATHPQQRERLIPAAIEAGKHVLSQKPFVMNLDRGQRFVDLAEKKGVKLAVNQNGRWAPHFSYLRQAVRKGVIGEVCSATLAVHWDHEWIRATPFDRVHHVILYDFAVHWFDMVHCLLGGREARRVFATLGRAGHQSAAPPLLGQCVIEFDDAQACLVFNGVTKFGALDETVVAGSKGTLLSRGPSLQQQAVTLFTGRGIASPPLEGTWFTEGFMGTMGELLLAIEQKRQPDHSAADNLASLAICFAAVASAETGRPQAVGKVRRVPPQTCQVAPG